MSPSKETLIVKIENVADAIVSTSPVGISVHTESVEPQLHIPYDPDYPQRVGFLHDQFYFEPAESPTDPDLLIGQVTESSFDDYKKNKPQTATPFSMAGVVLTLASKDKQPRILIGIRGSRNRAYSRQLTLTAVGGFMDVTRQENGLIEPLTDQLIDDTFIKEAKEEVGISSEKIVGMRRIAIVEDLWKPHKEFDLNSRRSGRDPWL